MKSAPMLMPFHAVRPVHSCTGKTITASVLHEMQEILQINAGDSTNKTKKSSNKEHNVLLFKPIETFIQGLNRFEHAKYCILAMIKVNHNYRKRTERFG